jgi:hypothetical protein
VLGSEEGKALESGLLRVMIRGKKIGSTFILRSTKILIKIIKLFKNPDLPLRKLTAPPLQIPMDQSYIRR